MKNTEKRKILIVYADEGIKESLGLILLDFYDTIKTNDASQAIEILKNNNDIFLVMLDINLPKFDKFETLIQIKKIYPDMKILIIAGHKSEEKILKATELGADGAVIKPFIAENILETIHKNS